MKIDQFFKNYNLIRDVFREMGLSWQRNDALLVFLKLAIWYQKPVFPSARWVGREANCNEKTVDRLVAWLKSEDLIVVKRTRRSDGYWSVNEIDFTPLLLCLRRLLGPILNQRPTRVITRREGCAISTKAGFVFNKAQSSTFWQSFISFRRLPTGKTSLLWRDPAMMAIIRA